MFGLHEMIYDLKIPNMSFHGKNIRQIATFFVLNDLSLNFGANSIEHPAYLTQSFEPKAERSV